MEAKIYNYKTWIAVTDSTLLVEKMNELLLMADYKVLNYMEHTFEPQGYTSIWLLAESHLAIHTFPEEGKTYIELSSCNGAKNEILTAGVEQWKSEIT